MMNFLKALLILMLLQCVMVTKAYADEPTPQQMAALSKADVYFRIGVPFESAWLDKIKLNNKNLKIVECCKSISNLNDHGHSHDHGHDYDPHVWTSPKKVIKIAELIKNSLIEIDNKNSAAYEASERSFNEMK